MCMVLVILLLQDLPPLKKKISVTFYKSATCDHTGEEEQRMPTLEDVFQEFPKIPINIDVKAEDTELMQKVRRIAAILSFAQ